MSSKSSNLEKHAKSGKNKQRHPCMDSRNRITSKLTKIDEIQRSNKGKLPTQKQETIFTVTGNQFAKQAEVKWAHKVVMYKQSFSSCDKKSEFFVSIFPDSNIAKGFTNFQRKCKPIFCFKITLYFTELLKNTLSEVDYLVSTFEESCNDVIKKVEIDKYAFKDVLGKFRLYVKDSSS